MTHLRIMPLGDSLTLGVIVNNGQVYIENGYRAELWAWLAQRGVQPDFVGSCGGDGCPDNPWPVYNRMGDWNHEGHAGMTTAQLAGIAPLRVSTYQPNVIVLLTGANDLRLNVSPSQYKIDLMWLVGEIHAAKSDVHIFLCSPTFKGNEPDWPAYVQIAHEVVNEHRANISLIPLHLVGQSDTNPGQINWGELSDGVHPTKCGYSRIAALIYEYMKRHPSVNPNGDAWPTPYWPWNTSTGPCKGVA